MVSFAPGICWDEKEAVVWGLSGKGLFFIGHLRTDRRGLLGSRFCRVAMCGV